jgi:hypothetical protein
LGVAAFLLFVNPAADLLRKGVIPVVETLGFETGLLNFCVAFAMFWLILAIAAFLGYALARILNRWIGPAPQFDTGPVIAKLGSEEVP